MAEPAKIKDIVLLSGGIVHPGRGLTILICLLLAAIAFTAYTPLFQNGFVNYDDEAYLTGNRDLAGGLTLENARRAFLTTRGGNWHPVTWLSHMADISLFGMRPAGHHGVSVAIHAANAVLLFIVLFRITRRRWECAFVAALLAVHPLHVESVAWAAERKDLLCAFFWIATIGAYATYVNRPGTYRYLGVLACFFLGLLSKAMIVTLPFVLLLLDYWPLRRFPGDEEGTPSTGSGRGAGSLLLEKIPLFGLTAIFCVVAYIAQAREKTITPFEVYPLSVRVANAFVAYTGYIGKLFWPTSLAVIYPHPGFGIPAWKIAGSALLLGGVTWGVIAQIRRRPYLAVGWFWFLGTLVPVIGIVQVGAQAMADRYSYLPFIGLSVMITWGLPDLLPKTRWRKPAMAGAAAVALGLLALTTRYEATQWRDSETLFRHALLSTSNNWVAEYNLGEALGRRGELGEAEAHYLRTLSIKYDFAMAHNNLANLIAKRGEIGRAIAGYREAIRIDPDLAVSHNNLANKLMMQGREAEALSCYREAIRLDNSNADFHFNFAVVLEKQGKIAEAIFHYREAARLLPGDSEVSARLVSALRRM